jgi:hypothetical protein
LLPHCATSNAPEKLPGRELTRPYTHPEGVSSWEFSGSFATQTTTAFPFYWKQGLTDRWMLVWIPIPFEARYQVRADEKGFWGLRANILGKLYLRTQNFDWSPFIESAHRWILNDWFALETQATFTAEIRRVGPSPNFVEAIEFGPLFQIGERVWVAPRLSTWIEFGEPRSLYIGDLPAAVNKHMKIRVPLVLHAGVYLARQWLELK